MLTHEFVPLLFRGNEEEEPSLEHLLAFTDSPDHARFRNVIPFIRQLRVLLCLSSTTEAQALVLYHRWTLTQLKKGQREKTTTEEASASQAHIEKRESLNRLIMSDQVRLYQLGAACLFLSGKLSDERRLLKDFAVCCLYYLYEKYRKKNPQLLNDTHRFAPTVTDFPSPASPPILPPPKRARKSAWDAGPSRVVPPLSKILDQFQTDWESAISAGELVILKAFGFMVNTQLPHSYIPVLHARVGLQGLAPDGVVVLNKSLVIATDLLSLPLCGVYFTALELAVVCYERALETTLKSVCLAEALGMNGDRAKCLRNILEWLMQ
eukprot:Blabericola_migrator_1__7331@NODE_372_length_9256_cov_73_169986_g297_i0_p6_GENE_NODE_372_length_9256_cov_73_169986_g297_i0NODE_372_length_9256_cov_73_169986_g297_i0_p6_ORF_typecomplete_len323_score41_24Cyclin_N/PF00134_23/4e06_NODE_372_length_9256_cov_73_169986_g297_i069737941